MSASTLARIFPVWKFPAGFFDFREFSSQNRIRVVQFCLINSGGLSRTPLRTVGCTYAGARILLFSSLSRRRKLRFFASLRKRLFCRPFASLTACKKPFPVALRSETQIFCNYHWVMQENLSVSIKNLFLNSGLSRR